MRDTLSPYISVDLVIFSLIEEQLCTLMIKRETSPFADCWALPIGLVAPLQEANLEQTAKQKVKSLLNLDIPYLEQVQTIGNNQRDPRGWSIAVVYYGLLSGSDLSGTDTDLLKWMTIPKALSCKLAFDHPQIIKNCLHRLKNKSLYTSLPIFLLPQEFTLTDLQKTYELILGFKMEKKSFRRRLLDAGFLQETGHSRHANHRPALLYRIPSSKPYFFPRIIEGVREARGTEE